MKCHSFMNESSYFSLLSCETCNFWNLALHFLTAMHDHTQDGHMRIRNHTCTYTHVCALTHITHAHSRSHALTCAPSCAHVHSYAFAHTCEYKFMHICMQPHMFACGCTLWHTYALILVQAHACAPTQAHSCMCTHTWGILQPPFTAYYWYQ